MRSLVALLFLLGACATPGQPPARVAGCWIDRSAGETTTMRWLNGPDGVLTGDLLVYNAAGAQRSARYTLEPRGANWAFCAHEAGVEPLCRAVAEGAAGPLAGGRVFIDAYGETLRISIIGDGPERTIFRGRRDGCD